jgi:hypothetical protein
MNIFRRGKKIKPLDENMHIIYAIYIELLELRRIIRYSCRDNVVSSMSRIVCALQIFREKAARAKLLLITTGDRSVTLRNIVMKINEMYDEALEMIDSACCAPIGPIGLSSGT